MMRLNSILLAAFTFSSLSFGCANHPKPNAAQDQALSQERASFGAATSTSSTGQQQASTSFASPVGLASEEEFFGGPAKEQPTRSPAGRLIVPSFR